MVAGGGKRRRGERREKRLNPASQARAPARLPDADDVMDTPHNTDSNQHADYHRTGENGDQEYDVEDVLKCELREGGIFYVLIKWDGYPHDANTWEPLENISSPYFRRKAERLISDYLYRRAETFGVRLACGLARESPFFVWASDDEDEEEKAQMRRQDELDLQAILLVRKLSLASPCTASASSAPSRALSSLPSPASAPSLPALTPAAPRAEPGSERSCQRDGGADPTHGDEKLRLRGSARLSASREEETSLLPEGPEDASPLVVECASPEAEESGREPAPPVICLSDESHDERRPGSAETPEFVQDDEPALASSCTPAISSVWPSPLNAESVAFPAEMAARDVAVTCSCDASCAAPAPPAESRLDAGGAERGVKDAGEGPGLFGKEAASAGGDAKGGFKEPTFPSSFFMKSPADAAARAQQSAGSRGEAAAGVSASGLSGPPPPPHCDAPGSPQVPSIACRASRGGTGGQKAGRIERGSDAEALALSRSPLRRRREFFLNETATAASPRRSEGSGGVSGESHDDGATPAAVAHAGEETRQEPCDSSRHPAPAETFERASLGDAPSPALSPLWTRPLVPAKEEPSLSSAHEGEHTSSSHAGGRGGDSDALAHRQEEPETFWKGGRGSEGEAPAGGQETPSEPGTRAGSSIESDPCSVVKTDDPEGCCDGEVELRDDALISFRSGACWRPPPLREVPRATLAAKQRSPRDVQAPQPRGKGGEGEGGEGEANEAWFAASASSRLAFRRRKAFFGQDAAAVGWSSSSAAFGSKSDAQKDSPGAFIHAGEDKLCSRRCDPAIDGKQLFSAGGPDHPSAERDAHASRLPDVRGVDSSGLEKEPRGNSPGGGSGRKCSDTKCTDLLAKSPWSARPGGWSDATPCGGREGDAQQIHVRAKRQDDVLPSSIVRCDLTKEGWVRPSEEGEVQKTLHSWFIPSPSPAALPPVPPPLPALAPHRPLALLPRFSKRDCDDDADRETDRRVRPEAGAPAGRVPDGRGASRPGAELRRSGAPVESDKAETAERRRGSATARRLEPPTTCEAADKPRGHALDACAGGRGEASREAHGAQIWHRERDAAWWERREAEREGRLDGQPASYCRGEQRLSDASQERLAFPEGDRRGGQPDSGRARDAHRAAEERRRGPLAHGDSERRSPEVRSAPRRRCDNARDMRPRSSTSPPRGGSPFMDRRDRAAPGSWGRRRDSPERRDCEGGRRRSSDEEGLERDWRAAQFTDRDRRRPEGRGEAETLCATRAPRPASFAPSDYPRDSSPSFRSPPSSPRASSRTIPPSVAWSYRGSFASGASAPSPRSARSSHPGASASSAVTHTQDTCASASAAPVPPTESSRASPPRVPALLVAASSAADAPSASSSCAPASSAPRASSPSPWDVICLSDSSPSPSPSRPAVRRRRPRLRRRRPPRGEDERSATGASFPQTRRPPSSCRLPQLRPPRSSPQGCAAASARPSKARGGKHDSHRPQGEAPSEASETLEGTPRTSPKSAAGTAAPSVASPPPGASRPFSISRAIFIALSGGGSTCCVVEAAAPSAATASLSVESSFAGCSRSPSSSSLSAGPLPLASASGVAAETAGAARVGARPLPTALPHSSGSSSSLCAASPPLPGRVSPSAACGFPSASPASPAAECKSPCPSGAHAPLSSPSPPPARPRLPDESSVRRRTPPRDPPAGASTAAAAAAPRRETRPAPRQASAPRPQFAPLPPSVSAPTSHKRAAATPTGPLHAVGGDAKRKKCLADERGKRPRAPSPVPPMDSMTLLTREILAFVLPRPAFIGEVARVTRRVPLGLQVSVPSATAGVTHAWSDGVCASADCENAKGGFEKGLPHGAMPPPVSVRCFCAGLGSFQASYLPAVHKDLADLLEALGCVDACVPCRCCKQLSHACSLAWLCDSSKRLRISPTAIRTPNLSRSPSLDGWFPAPPAAAPSGAHASPFSTSAAAAPAACPETVGASGPPAAGMAQPDRKQAGDDSIVRRRLLLQGTEQLFSRPCVRQAAMPIGWIPGASRVPQTRPGAAPVEGLASACPAAATCASRRSSLFAAREASGQPPLPTPPARPSLAPHALASSPPLPSMSWIPSSSVVPGSCSSLHAPQSSAVSPCTPSAVPPPSACTVSPSTTSPSRSASPFFSSSAACPAAAPLSASALPLTAYPSGHIACAAPSVVLCSASSGAPSPSASRLFQRLPSALPASPPPASPSSSRPQPASCSPVPECPADPALASSWGLDRAGSVPLHAPPLASLSLSCVPALSRLRPAAPLPSPVVQECLLRYATPALAVSAVPPSDSGREGASASAPPPPHTQLAPLCGSPPFLACLSLLSCVRQSPPSVLLSEFLLSQSCRHGAALSTATGCRRLSLPLAGGAAEASCESARASPSLEFAGAAPGRSALPGVSAAGPPRSPESSGPAPGTADGADSSDGTKPPFSPASSPQDSIWLPSSKTHMAPHTSLSLAPDRPRFLCGICTLLLALSPLPLPTRVCAARTLAAPFTHSVAAQVVLSEHALMPSSALSAFSGPACASTSSPYASVSVSSQCPSPSVPSSAPQPSASPPDNWCRTSSAKAEGAVRTRSRRVSLCRLGFPVTEQELAAALRTSWGTRRDMQQVPTLHILSGRAASRAPAPRSCPLVGGGDKRDAGGPSFVGCGEAETGGAHGGAWAPNPSERMRSLSTEEEQGCYLASFHMNPTDTDSDPYLQFPLCMATSINRTSAESHDLRPPFTARSSGMRVRVQPDAASVNLLRLRVQRETGMKKGDARQMLWIRYLLQHELTWTRHASRAVSPFAAAAAPAVGLPTLLRGVLRLQHLCAVHEGSCLVCSVQCKHLVPFSIRLYLWRNLALWETMARSASGIALDSAKRHTQPEPARGGGQTASSAGAMKELWDVTLERLFLKGGFALKHAAKEKIEAHEAQLSMPRGKKYLWLCPVCGVSTTPCELLVDRLLQKKLLEKHPELTTLFKGQRVLTEDEREKHVLLEIAEPRRGCIALSVEIADERPAGELALRTAYSN
ncbi:hypothetical protein BESB_007920 [Besnoitia besnoiti]|uniref:Chromo domain-containing protein n=1 Tax=Besnoitia besnoiti TaxID=94643 RepID=A0A2A9MQQ4_BESBE|nr:hypothetical protein BESB_007920 [Besnoitia besnoiti]PFH38450.1 hypothetical protein BESB_007920 [Besnoitia besnoiti]